MYETPADIDALQELLDRSYAGAGPHLLRIHTPERRLNGEQVAQRLTGMRGSWPNRPRHSASPPCSRTVSASQDGGSPQ